ncbi:MAG TPA: response regulator transcription factor [Tepidisphaeraceae bacterium]
MLIVSNRRRNTDSLRQVLTKQNFVVEEADSIGGAVAMLDEQSASLCIVDTHLSDGPGTECIRALRAADHGMPAIWFSADDSDDAKIKALDIGVDEVLTWPLVPSMFMAHVRSLLRRCQPSESALLKYEDLSLDLRSLEVTRDGKMIRSTSREIAVLEYLLRHPERVIVRSELIDAVWDSSLPPESNVVEVFIARLRRKIDRPFDKHLIHTIVGRGYMLSVSKPGIADYATRRITNRTTGRITRNGKSV